MPEDIRETTDVSKPSQTQTHSSTGESSKFSRRTILKGIGAVSTAAVTANALASTAAADDTPTTEPKTPGWAVGKHDRNQKRGRTARNYELGAVLQYEGYDPDTHEHTFSMSWSGFCSIRNDRTVQSDGIGGQFLHIDCPESVEHLGPKGDSNKKGIGPVDRESEYNPGYGKLLATAVGVSAIPKTPIPAGGFAPGFLMAGSDIILDYLVFNGAEKPDGYWIHESYTDATQYEIIHGERVEQAWGFYKDFRLKDPSPDDSDPSVVRIACGEGEFGGTGELVSNPPGDVEYGRQYLREQALTDSVWYQGDKGAGVEFELYLDGENGVRVNSPVFEPIYSFDSIAADYDKNVNGRISEEELDEAKADWENDEISNVELNHVTSAYYRTQRRKR
ncbi:hypothetical protein [Halorhabdus salina]|uniref:hypothetical protein n=1 Tax=Halorhabdus salina TaxID=2750670 RepID=UPI0015EF85B8|nr:hypothetical protein [Halorhabdus salina]